MKEKTNIPLQKLVKKYKAKNDKINIKDRLRYAMAQTMCYGKEVNTPDMKKILMTLVEPEEQTAGQLKTKLVKLFVFADLFGEELTYDFAKKVYTEKFNMSFGETKQEQNTLYTEYKDAIYADAKNRVGDNLAAYDVVIRARRLCRLMALGAPTIIIDNEARLLAQAMVIKDMETVDNVE